MHTTYNRRAAAMPVRAENFATRAAVCLSMFAWMGVTVSLFWH